MSYKISLAANGAIIAVITTLLGGWDESIITLLIFMAVDYLLGLITAFVFHKSTKTPTGAASSAVCFKGLVKKFVSLALVLIAYRLDIIIGVSYIRDATCIALIINEGISIIENAGLCGIPIPQAIINAIDVLKEREKHEN